MMKWQGFLTLPFFVFCGTYFQRSESLSRCPVRRHVRRHVRRSHGEGGSHSEGGSLVEDQRLQPVTTNNRLLFMGDWRDYLFYF
jgi:hypothetical protein